MSTNFLQELQRRKVVRVAGVYAVVAWLLIQVADNLVPALQLPIWANSLVVFFLLMGFPIALVLAWAYEIVPAGERQNGDLHAATAPSNISSQAVNNKLLYAMFALLLVAVTFQIGDRLFFNASSSNTSAVITTANGSDQVVRFSVPVSEDGAQFLGGAFDAIFGRPSTNSLALSPDGSQLAFTAWEYGADGSVSSRLYLRDLEQLQAVALPGTENASAPFFAPDGQWIGYFAGPSLRRVAVSGGASQTIVAHARLPFSDTDDEFNYFGASWGDDSSIVYGGLDGLYRVAASGGEPRLILAHDNSAGNFYRFAQPHFLPGSTAVLLHAMLTRDPRSATIALLDLTTGTFTTLLADAMHPILLDTGQLLFLRRGVLMAVAFDLASRAVTGDAIEVLDNVQQALAMPNPGYNTGAGQIAVSRTGHLVYAPGGLYPRRSTEVIRVTHDGTEIPLGLESGDFVWVTVSPDGARLLLTYRAQNTGTGIMLHDLSRGVSSPVDTGGFTNTSPRFSPDGLSFAFATERDGIPFILHSMRVDGSQAPVHMISRFASSVPGSWSAGGAIAYVENSLDIWILPPEGEPVPFLNTAAAERQPSFSPDGSWLAYVSDISGRFEIYVRPYPGPGAAVQVSANGGGEPAWSPAGERLYFTSNNADASARLLKVVDITLATAGADATLRAGREAVMIEPWPYLYTAPTRSFDVAPDGSFIVIKPLGAGTELPGVNLIAENRRRFAVPEFQLILNFAAAVRARMAPEAAVR